MKENNATMTKKLDEDNVKHISLLILKIMFSSLFENGVNITPHITLYMVKKFSKNQLKPNLGLKMINLASQKAAKIINTSTMILICL